MPHSFANLILQILFSTKRRRPWLKDPAVRREFYAYMGGILKAIGSTPIEINGVEDHVHLLCTMPRQHAISKIVEEIKSEPSKWLKRKGPAYRGFYWQEVGLIERGVREQRVALSHPSGAHARCDPLPRAPLRCALG